MKVVVTGASGFLGRSVVRRLSLTPGTIVPVSRRALPDIVHVADYADAPAGDVLIHLAEAAHRGAVERAGPTYEQDTFAGLSALLKKRYQRIIYASSAVLYGDQAPTPRHPRDEVFVSDTYTRVKRRAEVAVLDSAGGLVVRLSNLYGPGMSGENVMSTILGQIPSAGPIRVRDIAPIRDFLWVDDAAEALVTMALESRTGIFNVGSGIGRSIGDVASLALKIAGQPDRLVVSTQRGARPSHLVLDISDTVSAWQWSPGTLMEEGINRLLSATRRTTS
jgi:UDP-glucose 4-epimerase